MTVEMKADTSAAPSGFAALGLAPQILHTLQQQGITTPTPIQQRAIPVAMKGEDLIGIAQTGTGKTLAFGLPMLNRLAQGKRSGGRGLIVLPTRELALQVDEALQQVGGPFGLRSVVLIGGAPMKPQQEALKRDNDIIVATPGRLLDHLECRRLDLRTVETLVLDEADRMLDMGFAPQIKRILQAVPPERQTLLFSATMPDQIVEIATRHMRYPTRVEIARAGTTADDVTQELYIVPQELKDEQLEQILYEYQGTVLVFARTRSRVARVTRCIKRLGHRAAELHSDRTLSQRRAALDGFKDGQYRILVATDIAARGIDVEGIELVLNYDLPSTADDYVHRIGRTARAGRSGHAISLATPDQQSEVQAIEKLIRSELPLAEDSAHEYIGGPSSRGRKGVSRAHSGGSRHTNPHSSAHAATSRATGSRTNGARSNGSRASTSRVGTSTPPRQESRTDAPQPGVSQGNSRLRRVRSLSYKRNSA